MKFILLSILLALTPVSSFAAKIQKQGIVTSSDCSTKGASNANCLPGADQIYDGVNSQQLSQTIRTLQSPVQTISASNVDWSAGTTFQKTLGANTTFTFSNIRAGQTIIIAITNTASNYTLAWPASACWAGGPTTCTAAAPVLTTGAHTDVFTCVSFDGTIAQCNAVQNF